jgi:RIP metalloprotease RseP
MSTTFPPEPARTDPEPADGPATESLGPTDSLRTSPSSKEPAAPPRVRFAALRLAAMVGVLAFIGWASPWTLVVILALVVMIFLHELGHFVMAKRAGMKATEFFIGFGPRIWSFHRGETEYGVKAIPAGAYVKIIGMHNIESVDPADEARTYRQKSFGQRVGVAVAGSTMHFILAVGLIYVALVGIGQPAGTLDPETQQREWFIESVVTGSGAEAAGLLPGDRIISIDGTRTEVFEDVRSAVDGRDGETVPIVYERDGQVVDSEITLQRFTSWIIDRVEPGGPVDAAGLEVGDQVVSIAGRQLSSANSTEELTELLAGVDGTTVPVVLERDEEEISSTLNVDTLALAGSPGFVGIGRGLPGDEKVGAVEGLVAAPREFVNLTTTSLEALGKFFTPGGISDFAGQVTSARSDRAEVKEEQRAASQPITETSSRIHDSKDTGDPGENRLLSIYGLVNIGSDIGEVDPGALVVLFAMINVFIGVFNLVPLLPFDGGHVAIAVYEKIQERRLNRRRYFADVGRLVPFANFVVLLMGMLFVSTIYLDIANPLVAR